MEGYEDLLSDSSVNEEACYSDRVDSDIEAELYGLIHHDTHDNSVPLQDKSESVEISSDFLHGSTENNSITAQNSSSLPDDISVLPVTNFVPSEDTISSTKNLKNSLKKSNQNYRTPVRNNHTSFFSSDAIVNSNLYFSFESPVRQKMQNSQLQSENSIGNATAIPSKRKSDAVLEILENIQLKKNVKSTLSEKNVSKQKKNKSDHNCITSKAESFIEIIDDSSDSDSDNSIIFLETDQSKLQTNITKETVVLSSDSEGSDSSMEKSFSRACQKNQIEVLNADISPNNKDPWHINSEDKFRIKKQSNRYHDNAVLTCSKCHLKGHSARFCSIPKVTKCFFCGEYHSSMNCKNKICTKCFHQGHDRRRCYIRYVDTCELCGMRGHSLKDCPDLWRRYHLTTSKGTIVKGNPNPHSSLYCYTCGSKGHYGAICEQPRTDRWSFPTWTSVISYKNPISVLRKRNERNLQEEDRSFNEINIQQKERNFNRRNRFNKTSLFRRKKGNASFSNDTPTQKTKKKKKKKSPKTPQPTNQQSITGAQSIVQNEVYFPRTPKMTPNSSMQPLSKKKSKKLRNQYGSLSRQQRNHRIELQQRLGLPFPSTI